MPSTDASTGADAVTGRAAVTGADAVTGTAADTGTTTVAGTAAATGTTTVAVADAFTASGSEETLELLLPDEFVARFRPGSDGPRTTPKGEDLLDSVADWGPAATPAGEFRLVPVEPARDLVLISRWMNDPAVAAFWELPGDEEVTAAHLRPQLEGDGRSVPCMGVLDGTPMSYWEIYRADLDPLARHYPARPHDTGIHLLLGGVADRGRGLGTTLLRAVGDLVLDHRPSCARVVAEPDLRNTPSVAAFLGAGFRFGAEIELPTKRAALMMRDRAHRHHL
ncbi:GNAT family N-acetyltransferase [Streptomyces sp. NPDC004111]|uniref:GNAT family N-acetyltransferase n=1 Tax=Streptomyces sp. NPDC004111 TaxID=3364690 RepID=UPI003689A3F8